MEPGPLASLSEVSCACLFLGRETEAEVWDVIFPISPISRVLRLPVHFFSSHFTSHFMHIVMSRLIVCDPTF